MRNLNRREKINLVFVSIIGNVVGIAVILWGIASLFHEGMAEFTTEEFDLMFGRVSPEPNPWYSWGLIVLGLIAFIGVRRIVKQARSEQIG
ncbi:MAG: hypothetical protein FWF59_04360 [Turicibacter sp.]|nr:hypothetical protein [Turicibacter sp.]